jgi:hypothetical protein
VIDDESTNTARKAEKVQTSLQTKAKTEPASHRLEMRREEFGERDYLPKPLLRLIDGPHRTTKHWVPPKPGRVSIRHPASTASQGDTPICRERRYDGPGESRMQEICTSGLTSGDWKRSAWLGMRHRRMTKAAGQRQLPQA